MKNNDILEEFLNSCKDFAFNRGQKDQYYGMRGLVMDNLCYLEDGSIYDLSQPIEIDSIRENIRL